jgi:aarF domain-containing kinase
MQWSSSRRDLFDAAICDRLASVQSSVAPHAERHTDRALRAAFGERWAEEVLALEMGRAVLGSGCIAQVYRGRLVGTGREVAVKVVHPHVRAQVEADLALFATLAAALERAVPSAKYWSIGDALHEFDGLMRSQLSMAVEATNLRRLRQNFAGHPNVAFPEPLLVHEDVLVEEFVHGEPISRCVLGGGGGGVGGGGGGGGGGGDGGGGGRRGGMVACLLLLRLCREVACCFHTYIA